MELADAVAHGGLAERRVHHHGRELGVADPDGAVEQVEPRLALFTDGALADGLPERSQLLALPGVQDADVLRHGDRCLDERVGEPVQSRADLGYEPVGTLEEVVELLAQQQAQAAGGRDEQRPGELLYQIDDHIDEIADVRDQRPQLVAEVAQVLRAHLPVLDEPADDVGHCATAPAAWPIAATAAWPAALASS